MFFFIFIVLNTKVPLLFQSNLLAIISNGSGEKVDFKGFAIFSNGGHLGYLTQIYNSETLESDHTSSEI